MIYIDMANYNDDDDEKPVLQHLMLGQLTEIIKQKDGETVALFDEAHNLLHSEEMVEWLQKAAREWARYESALHFVTQSTQEFVKRAKGVGEGQENDRQTIFEQCSTISVFLSPETERETLKQIGLETDELIDVAQTGLVPARADDNYTTFLSAFTDRESWYEYQVEASPLMQHILNYDADEHDAEFGDFGGYVESFDGDDDHERERDSQEMELELPGGATIEDLMSEATAD